MSETHVVPRWVRIISVAAIAACSTEPTSNDPATRRMFAAVGPQTATVLQGDSSKFSVNLSSNGDFSGVPQLTISGAHAGITTRVTVTQTAPSIASAVIAVNVGQEVEPGLYVLWLVA